MGGETKQAKHKDNEPGWVIQSGSGSGGVAELVENLDKDAVQYGLCKSPSFFFVFFFLLSSPPTHLFYSPPCGRPRFVQCVFRKRSISAPPSSLSTFTTSVRTSPLSSRAALALSTVTPSATSR